MRRLGIDGDVDVEDVRRLAKGHAARIFKEHYFVKPGIGALPKTLQASVFDMYVNAGSAAIRILQRLLAQFGIPVSIDGILGPQTVAATNKTVDIAPDHFVDAYGIVHRNYYYNLAGRRVTSRKYVRSDDGGKGGWIKRAEEFTSRRFHLTINEHNQKVMAWD